MGGRGTAEANRDPHRSASEVPGCNRNPAADLGRATSSTPGPGSIASREAVPCNQGEEGPGEGAGMVAANEGRAVRPLISENFLVQILTLGRRREIESLTRFGTPDRLGSVLQHRPDLPILDP